MDLNRRSDLERWQAAGVIDADTAARIQAFEASRAGPSHLRWPILIALAFGGLMICGGILLFVAANWDVLSPTVRFMLVLLLVAAFHVAGATTAERFPAMSQTMHAVGTTVLGAGIALAGQIFNLEEHWPGGIMLWALGAAIGWLLLRHTAQAALFAILAPAWLMSEWTLASENVNRGKSEWILTSAIFLLAITYVTATGPGKTSRQRRALLWIGTAALLLSAAALSMMRGDRYYAAGIPLPRMLEAIGWTGAIGGPLVLAACLRRTDAWVNTLAAVWIVLMYLMRNTAVDASLYAWWALGAIGMAAWGVRDGRVERINLGAFFFAATVLAFYFSEVMDKLGRSASLIGLGLLFLGGGWALERARRNLVRQSREA